MTERDLPWSRDAEMAVLGSVLIAPRVLAELEDLSPEAFYLPAHREIWAAMGALKSRQRAIDPVALSDELKARGTLPRLEGGDGYLLELARAVPTSENVAHYARLVREKATLRRVIALCGEMGSRARGDVQVDDLVGDFRQAVAALEQAGEGPVRVGDVMFEVLDVLEAKAKHKDGYFVPTGLLAFDQVLGGLGEEKLIVVAGPPGMGKSAAAGGMAVEASGRGIPALVVTLEMGQQESIERWLGREAGIAPFDLNAGRMSGDGWARLTRAARTLEPRPLWVDTRSRSLRQILGTVRRWHARFVAPKKKRALLVVDYMQLIRMQGDGRRRDVELGDVAGELKALAVELHIPAVALSSVNRDWAKREKNQPPQMSDLRDSGVIEHHADVIMFPWRKSSSDNESGDAEWIVAKNRGGKKGSIGCYWNAPLMRFEDKPDVEHERQESMAV